MLNPQESRDNSTDDTRLDRATFVRGGLLAAAAITVIGGSVIKALRPPSTPNIGYEMHLHFGHAIGNSELRDRVHKFLMEVNVPDEEWCSRYTPVFEAYQSGDKSKLTESRALWEEKKQRFGFEATYARIFGNEPRYDRVCDWYVNGEVCYDYAFETLRREEPSGHILHHEGFHQDLKEMGYIPVEKPQDFDIVMYYKLDFVTSAPQPCHWGMMYAGQVISVNLSEEYVMRHDVDAIAKDRGGTKAPTHVMYFRKADPNLRDPRLLPLTKEMENYVELNGAMVPRNYRRRGDL